MLYILFPALWAIQLSHFRFDNISFFFLSSGKGKQYLPIGPWIVTPTHDTLPGRFRVDLRHLKLTDPIPKTSSSRSNLVGVPGWIGVKGTKAKGKDGQIIATAPYYPVLYESSTARQLVLLYPEFDTAEEAAHLYDRLALAYCGPTEVDTNYPIDDEAKEAAASKKGPKYVITCAVEVLNLERSMPEAAVAGCTATAKEWEEWE